MTLTIDVEGEPGVRIADADVTVDADGRVAFAVEGVLRVGGDALAPLVGARLTPVEVAFAAAGDRVAIDLAGDAELRLDAVDVGVELPTDGGTSDPADAAASPPDPTDAPADPTELVGDVGRISFTVEGVVENVPDDAAERLADADAEPRSIAFSVDETTATDGGDAEAPVATIELVAIRVAVLVDGTIVVTALDADAGLL